MNIFLNSILKFFKISRTPLIRSTRSGTKFSAPSNWVSIGAAGNVGQPFLHFGYRLSVELLNNSSSFLFKALSSLRLIRVQLRKVLVLGALEVDICCVVLSLR